jgi:integrase
MAKRNTNYSTISIRQNKYVTLYFKNTRFTTSYVIDGAEDFNKISQKFSSKWQNSNSGAVEVIEKYKIKIDSLIKNARAEGVDELEYIKRAIEEENNKLKRANISDNQVISDAFDEFYNKVIDKEIKRENSKLRFKSHLNKLRWFEEKDKTTLSGVDMDFIYSFIKWMAEEKKYIQHVTEDAAWGRTYTAEKSARNSNSTIKRWLNDFNRFLKWCSVSNPSLLFPHEEISKLSYSLKTNADNQEIVAMSKKQWEAFKEFKLPQHLKGLQKSYDAYYYCVKTSLRYSDFKKLNMGYVDDKTITMRATKTNYKFVVKMAEDAWNIFKKYNFDFSDFPTTQRLSINLRKILKQIPEFQGDSIKYEYYLEKVDEIQIKEWEKFTFHSSRRTSASLLISCGANTGFVMKTLGWSNARMLEKYLAVLNSEDAEDSYFNF